ncbi:MAG: GHMP kinase [Actinomycetia bacterium]|nr:GHMP kinase [Actinomycetes bacterium]
MADQLRVTAPVRVLDIGCWTDTWFAVHGEVCSIAVGDGVDVSLELTAPRPGHEPEFDLWAHSYDQRYTFSPLSRPGHHPLLESTLLRWCPPDVSAKVEISSPVPPGCGVGTSAAVVVAMITALWAAAGKPLDPQEIAVAAHRIETEDVGLQSGVQDQRAAAYGGANLIVIDPYPTARVQPVPVSEQTWQALTDRLITVYLGMPHESSALHESVIARLTGTDREPLLEPLRLAALRAATALAAGDLDALGAAAIDATDAQAQLHPDLVGARAREVIDCAAGLGAVGWKVNGAGGEGGTVTVIGPPDPGPLLAALDAISYVTRLNLVPTRTGATVVG